MSSEPPSSSAASWASRGSDPRLRKPRSPRLRRLRRACAVLGLPRLDWLSSTAVGKRKQLVRRLWGRGCDNRRRHPRTNLELTRKLGRVAYPRPWISRTVERPGSRHCRRHPDLLLPLPEQGDRHPSERRGPDHPPLLGENVSARRIRQDIRKVEQKDYTPELKYLELRKPGRTYVGGLAFMFKGLDAPLPCVRHVGPRNGPHPLRNLLLAQHLPADPGGVERATHVADLVSPGLQRANPAADEGSE